MAARQSTATYGAGREPGASRVHRHAAPIALTCSECGAPIPAGARFWTTWVQLPGGVILSDADEAFCRVACARDSDPVDLDDFLDDPVDLDPWEIDEDD